MTRTLLSRRIVISISVSISLIIWAYTRKQTVHAEANSIESIPSFLPRRCFYSDRYLESETILRASSSHLAMKTFVAVTTYLPETCVLRHRLVWVSGREPRFIVPDSRRHDLSANERKEDDEPGTRSLSSEGCRDPNFYSRRQNYPRRFTCYFLTADHMRYELTRRA